MNEIFVKAPKFLMALVAFSLSFFQTNLHSQENSNKKYHFNWRAYSGTRREGFW